MGGIFGSSEVQNEKRLTEELASKICSTIIFVKKFPRQTKTNMVWRE
jgi:hypothetical protein